MSPGQWVIAFLVAYVLGTMLWIKGTDAQSSDFWMWCWRIVKFLLLCIVWPLGIFLVLMWFMGRGRHD